MSTIKVKDKVFEPYLTAAEIDKAIHRLGASLCEDYQDKRPLFIAILNGSFMFAADLFKNLPIEAEISFIKLASYKGTKSTGQVVTAIGLDIDIHNRHVVIIEDIVDTGKTLNAFLPQLRHQHPASLELVALLNKPEATEYTIPIKYLGFSIPDKFVVGYGLDYDGLGRNLADIYRLKEEQ
ncbi:hypoxanthine phosphoribosyltransferase [Flavihumibacter profundi]|uniref:hypoxanthine phosphoribosyltransferase n=1 Tax=Flavihumibacter profundi TaxID=2716883 RepID=UPI001CC5DB39|nr:hypoxanthine phosphoribosyltransferase [Flavihumibacter profundi]MBZ5859264.1 hypoxanthine phosphoribosyltransferase [Flavihumibacter profundi]